MASANSKPRYQIPTAKSLPQPGGATAIAAAGNGSHRPIAPSAHAPNPASLARVMSDWEHKDSNQRHQLHHRQKQQQQPQQQHIVHEQSHSRLNGHPPPPKPPGSDGSRHQQNQGQQNQDELALKLMLQSCSQVFAPPAAERWPLTPALQALAGPPPLRREDLGQSAHTPETITTSQHPQPVLFNRSDEALGRRDEAGVGAGGRGGAPKGKASKWCDGHRRLPDSKLSTAEMDPKLAGQSQQEVLMSLHSLHLWLSRLPFCIPPSLNVDICDALSTSLYPPSPSSLSLSQVVGFRIYNIYSRAHTHRHQ